MTEQYRDWLRSIRGNRILRLADSSGLTAFKILNAANQVLWEAYSDGRMTSEGYLGNLDDLDVTGKITVGSATPRIEIDGPNQRIQTSNFVAGSAGFRLDGDGSAEFNDATVRGTLYAGVGEVGGFSIGAVTLTGGNALLHSSGYLLLGTGNDVIRIDAANATYRLWAGNATAASAPFRVTKGGVLTATGATISGALTATSGSFTGTVRIGSSSPYIDLDGTNKRVRTSTFNAGYQGYSLEVDGSAEFNNVTVRGAIQSSVFEYGLISAHAGSSIWTKSSGVLAADMVTAFGSWYMYIKDPSGGGFLFANNDICRCKSTYSGGVGDVWFTVDSRTDMGDGTQRYTCTRTDGTFGTFPAGATVLDYGVSGAGGVTITADASGAPHLSVFTHAGSPWTTLTERARLGNLNGNWGYVADTYGIGLGQYAANLGNMTWDATNGLRLRTYSTTVIQFDASGNADITGKLRMPGASSALAIGSTPPTASNSGTGIWLDRTGLFALSAGTYQVKIDATDGKLYAGAGNVILDSSGVSLVSGGGAANTIKFMRSGSAISTIVNSVGAGYSMLMLISAGTATDSGVVRLEGWNSTHAVGVNVLVDGVQIRSISGTSKPSLVIERGLYVGGTSADPAAGYIHATNWASGLLPWTPGAGFTSPVTATGTIFVATIPPTGSILRWWRQAIYTASPQDASNYWTITIDIQSAATTVTTRATFDTKAATVTRWNLFTVNDINFTFTGWYMMRVQATTTGSPGSLYFAAPETYIQ